jgi:hypothetical protein
MEDQDVKAKNAFEAGRCPLQERGVFTQIIDYKSLILYIEAEPDCVREGAFGHPADTVRLTGSIYMKIKILSSLMSMDSPPSLNEPFWVS